MSLLPVICLMGPTASGKTNVSIAVARQLRAEIVSVDSALVYRGMDIGTAKPDLAERQGIEHHLIDVRDPWDSYSAAAFCDDTNRLIQQISDRGNRVMLVGGTMLYFKALEQGLARLPEADQPLRDALLQELRQVGTEQLHTQLRRIDPESAARIHPNDPQRIVRAIEVYRLSGQSMSSLIRQTRSRLQAPLLKFALVPEQRSWLHRRIEQRFSRMIELGFLDEVRELAGHTRIHANLPAMRSVGYRQALEHIESGTGGTQWIAKGVAATRQLAKRQMTWLRGMSGITTITCDSMKMAEQASVILSDPRTGAC